eukprot:scaffold80105_cov39-Tisochrysis_lutea.AAC.2
MPAQMSTRATQMTTRRTEKGMIEELPRRWSSLRGHLSRQDTRLLARRSVISSNTSTIGRVAG